MIKALKKHRRLATTLTLAFMCAACVALSLLRCLYTGTHTFLFLNWNLFLAFLPWLFTSLYMMRPRWQRSVPMFMVVFCSWLLFFPNAPYILTDLFHLRLRTGIPVWFDLVLITAYAWTGMMFGLTSLSDIEISLRRWIPRNAARIISVGLLFTGSFGVYLGRYLRWNSWDVFDRPSGIIADIGDRLVNPLEHMGTWGMTILLGVLLNMIYWSLKAYRADSLTGRDSDSPHME